MTEKTVERLNRVLEAIDPKRLDMGCWVRADAQNGAAYPVPLRDDTAGIAHEYLKPAHRKACGTVACLAGWTCVVFPPRKARDKESEVRDYAEAKLDLTMVEADRLFAQHRWPTQFHERYTNSATGRGRLAALKARVKHFIATEGRE